VGPAAADRRPASAPVPTYPRLVCFVCCRLLDLATGTISPLPAPEELAYLAAAAWSPDEAYLASIGVSSVMPSEYSWVALLLARGGGSDVRTVSLPLVLLPIWQVELAWQGDGKTLLVSTPEGSVRVDSVTGEVASD